MNGLIRKKDLCYKNRLNFLQKNSRLTAIFIIFLRYYIFAQLVEHATENRSVGGSIPPPGHHRETGDSTLIAKTFQSSTFPFSSIFKTSLKSFLAKYFKSITILIKNI